mmetsp:Transcript_11675/g.11594  ORF Transcript_11675/g.11594 Transcript_11675/m.11594 type:complete len:111 (+) Transcript_11675:6-338(+)
MSQGRQTYHSSLFEDTINSVQLSNEYAQSLGGHLGTKDERHKQSAVYVNTSHEGLSHEKYKRVSFNRDINEKERGKRSNGRSGSRERVDKMRDIKGEINELLTKIDSASK